MYFMDVGEVIGGRVEEVLKAANLSGCEFIRAVDHVADQVRDEMM